ncbi:MAG: peptidoglycan DD-metalloendopeptidase family protein, partial [Acidobacteria bacterium]|nr:peptidoglycan DD-metalloendopeptidase family protein [Acidobacteriota bacterium]NIQ84734.1 peptidoglycan DD-metalloendopeptidase family protein [Acidobacteriota bacterium]
MGYRFRLTTWAFLAIALAGPACASEKPRVPVRLDIRVDARAVVPGEPLRVRVASNVALESLAATLLDEAVYMTPADESGLHWSGWSMIGLDEEPGTVSLEFRGATTDGREASGARAIGIAPKEFPEENLKVAPKFVEPPPEALERIASERARLEKIYRHRERYVPPSAAFVRPVSGVKTSIFGMRRLFNGQPRSPHPGLDLRADEGTPVHASGPGRVVLAENLYYSGNIVIIDHGGG